MLNWVFDIVKIGSGIVTGWLAHTWRINAEQVARRRAFCNLLRVQVQRFDSMNCSQFKGGELWRMHQDSVATIADECAKIWTDIPPKHKLAFRMAQSAYCGLKQQDIEPFDLSGYPNNASAILFPGYEHGCKKAAELLRKLMENAK